MRYLSRSDVIAGLSHGRPMEQLLPERNESGYLVIRFVRLDREPDSKFSATLFEVIDDGAESFLDIYEFSPVDPDFPYGKGEPFCSAEEAVDFSCEKMGAKADEFVNAGVVQDEYRDKYHPDWQ